MSISRINQAFKNGEALKSGPVDLVMRQCEIGEILLPSGRVVACDPIHLYDLRPFAGETAPGRYPVVISIAEARESGAQRVACAMLRIRNETPVRWELATKIKTGADQIYDNETHGYGVDVGLGSFMDLEAAHLLQAKMDEDDRYHDHIFESLEVHHPEWASIELDPVSGLNFMVFQTGLGDGFYSSFWGYDKFDNITCLVTDFDLFDQMGEEAKDWAWK
jgi:hypothetical protein